MSPVRTVTHLSGLYPAGRAPRRWARPSSYPYKLRSFTSDSRFRGLDLDENKYRIYREQKNNISCRPYSALSTGTDPPRSLPGPRRVRPAAIPVCLRAGPGRGIPPSWIGCARPFAGSRGPGRPGPTGRRLSCPSASARSTRIFPEAVCRRARCMRSSPPIPAWPGWRARLPSISRRFPGAARCSGARARAFSMPARCTRRGCGASGSIPAGWSSPGPGTMPRRCGRWKTGFAAARLPPRSARSPRSR